jgi:hypothetical protein
MYAHPAQDRCQQAILGPADIAPRLRGHPQINHLRARGTAHRRLNITIHPRDCGNPVHPRVCGNPLRGGAGMAFYHSPPRLREPPAPVRSAWRPRPFTPATAGTPLPVTRRKYGDSGVAGNSPTREPSPLVVPEGCERAGRVLGGRGAIPALCYPPPRDQRRQRAEEGGQPVTSSKVAADPQSTSLEGAGHLLNFWSASILRAFLSAKRKRIQ